MRNMIHPIRRQGWCDTWRLQGSGGCLTPDSIDNDSALKMLAVVCITHTDIRGPRRRHGLLCLLCSAAPRCRVELVALARENMRERTVAQAMADRIRMHEIDLITTADHMRLSRTLFAYSCRKTRLQCHSVIGHS